MGTWLRTQFGQLTLASCLVLVSFPFLQAGGRPGREVVMWLGLALFMAGMAIPLVNLVQSKMCKTKSG